MAATKVTLLFKKIRPLSSYTFTYIYTIGPWGQSPMYEEDVQRRYVT